MHFQDSLPRNYVKSVQIRTRKNSVFGHFLRSDKLSNMCFCLVNDVKDIHKFNFNNLYVHSLAKYKKILSRCKLVLLCLYISFPLKRTCYFLNSSLSCNTQLSLYLANDNRMGSKRFCYQGSLTSIYPPLKQVFPDQFLQDDILLWLSTYVILYRSFWDKIVCSLYF